MRLALIVLCALAVSGCQTSQSLSNCAGWQKSTFKRSTYDYLYQHDRKLLLSTISNNENGAESGCWK